MLDEQFDCRGFRIEIDPGDFPLGAFELLSLDYEDATIYDCPHVSIVI